MSAKKPPRHSPAAQARAAQQSLRRQAALNQLASLDCLRGVPASELARLLELGTFRSFQTNATVLGQQRQDRFLFLVLRGTLQLRLRDKDGREVLMGVLDHGDCCGEGPLFGEFFRRMSALAQSNCHLLQIPLAELRATLPTLPMLATALRLVYKRRMLECTLARVPLLGELYPMERLALGSLLQPAHAARGSLIMRQGEPADALYLIESGQVVVEQSGQTIATLGEGDFFGEMSLLTGEKRSATVIALSDAECFRLDKEIFKAVIQRRPDLAADVAKVLARRRVELIAVREGLDLEAAARKGRSEADLLNKIRDFFSIKA